MDIERIKENVNDEDFIIRIRPFADNDGREQIETSHIQS